MLAILACWCTRNHLYELHHVLSINLNQMGKAKFCWHACHTSHAPFFEECSFCAITDLYQKAFPCTVHALFVSWQHSFLHPSLLWYYFHQPGKFTPMYSTFSVSDVVVWMKWILFQVVAYIIRIFVWFVFVNVIHFDLKQKAFHVRLQHLALWAILFFKLFVEKVICQDLAVVKNSHSDVDRFVENQLAFVHVYSNRVVCKCLMPWVQMTGNQESYFLSCCCIQFLCQHGYAGFPCFCWKQSYSWACKILFKVTLCILPEFCIHPDVRLHSAFFKLQPPV